LETSVNFHKVTLVTATLCVSLAIGSTAEVLAADGRFPGAAWERVDPAVGWSSDKLAKAEAWSRQIGSSAVIVVHRGAVVAEWGDTAAETPLASVRKSLLSALIGNAVERGQIDLSKTMGALGIDDNKPSLTAEEKTATVRDLLQARSGVYHAALYETPGMAAMRPPRFSHKPGTFWYYNNWDFNALGTIYERAVNSSIFDSFEREIARPIGMQDYQPSDGEYFTGAASVHAAYPIKMSARDLARFALLYLRKGRWLDRQIIPAHWTEQSTRAYSASTYGPGYGYMWWTGSINNGAAPSVDLPEGSFFATGSGGQYAFVIPAYDLVIVHRTANISDGGPNLRSIGRLLWLLFDAGGYPDIGPDASIEAARHARASGEVLSRALPGKTLLYGHAAAGGPYRIRLNADGRAVVLKGSEPTELDTGSWFIDGDQFCRNWEKIQPRRTCLAVTIDGSMVQLFDNRGLMFIEGHLVDD
jgi:CubicO group peptidase (beta-lactamase class C family)